MIRIGAITIGLVLVIAAVWGYRASRRPAAEPIARQFTRVEASLPDTASRNESAATPQVTAFTFQDALALAEQGLVNLHTNVVDYRARLVKQERLGDQLLEASEMRLKVQNPGMDADGKPLRPMRVYLEFIKPNTGREVIWGEDLAEGKLIAHEGGFLNLIRLNLDPRGMVAMQGNRYPIDHIGLAYLTQELLQRGKAAPAEIPLRVEMQDNHPIGERICKLIHVESPGPEAGLGFAQLDIAVDLEHMIPLHFASYDWVKGNEEPQLVESYTYYDVELNPGLTDQDFNPDNTEYHFP